MIQNLVLIIEFMVNLDLSINLVKPEKYILKT